MEKVVNSVGLEERKECKKCSKCGEVKLLSEFNKDKSRKSGCRAYCKSCTRKIGVEYRSKNHNKELERCARYRRLNSKSCKERLDNLSAILKDTS